MKFLVKIFLSLTVFTLGLVAAEFYLRYFLKNIDDRLAWTASRSYDLDSELIYARLPNSYALWKSEEFEEKVQANNLGFRDEDVGEKESGIYRIIAVGDSFTFGHGIENNEETYPNQLEDYLNEKREKGKKIEVINAGEKGYSPDQEYKLIKGKLLGLAPDAIIWNFSIPGDLYNLVHTYGWPVPSLYDVREEKLVELNPKYNWLYISNFLRYRFPLLNKSILFNKLVKIAASKAIFSRKEANPDKSTLERAKQKMLLEVTEVQKFAEKYNFKLIVTFLPYPTAFSDNFLSSIEGKIVQQFKDDLLRKGVRVVDVKEEVEKFNLAENKDKEQNVLGVSTISETDLYYKTDYHPNKFGASIFAKIVGVDIQQYLPVSVEYSEK